MKRIAILGAGSGGILSICYFLGLSEEFEITSIYNPKIPSVGIGESTNPFFFGAIQDVLHIPDLDQFIKQGNIDSTIKYGTLYKNWRKKDFTNPLFNGGDIAIHFNTHLFKDFVFERLRKYWSNKFKEIKGNVSHIENNLDNIILNIDGKEHSFDYVIDCRGFPKSYEDYNVLDMPINHCLVHNTPELNNWEYTLHQATEDGWLFGVPLASRTSYGYLFNDNITKVEDAKINFSKTINIPVEQLQNIEYKFKNYYAKNIINNRLMINGNNAVFFEPMFANSLYLYNCINDLIYYHIKEEHNEYKLNEAFKYKVLEIHDLICYYYHGGSKFTTDFWKYAIKYSKNILKDSLFFKELCNKFSYMKKNNCIIDTELQFTAEQFRYIDRSLEYYYWTKQGL